MTIKQSLYIKIIAIIIWVCLKSILWIAQTHTIKQFFVLQLINFWYNKYYIMNVPMVMLDLEHPILNMVTKVWTMQLEKGTCILLKYTLDQQYAYFLDPVQTFWISEELVNVSHSLFAICSFLKFFTWYPAKYQQSLHMDLWTILIFILHIPPSDTNPFICVLELNPTSESHSKLSMLYQQLKIVFSTILYLPWHDRPINVAFAY